MTPEAFLAFAKVLPEPSLLLNTQGRILAANPASERLGSPPSRLQGRLLFELVATPREQLERYLATCLGSGQMVPGGLEWLDGERGPRPYRCEGAAVRPDGASPGLIFLRLRSKEEAGARFALLNQKIDELTRALRQRIRTEGALRESQRHLKELMEAQKRFVNDAAHELRAPLTSLQGNLEVLLSFPHMPEAERQDALRDAVHEARRLSRLVNDMLALARGDAGAALQLASVRLDRVLREVLESAQGLVRQHRLSLGPLDEALVRGDGDRLGQLVLQLLENAVKYTPPGGSIAAGVRRVGEEAELRVSDTGIGIAPEDLPHVFERFWRADRARVRGEDPGGTGLGLSIARWIVEQHGGRIWLESEPGEGTTAIVRLPLSDAAEA